MKSLDRIHSFIDLETFSHFYTEVNTVILISLTFFKKYFEHQICFNISNDIHKRFK